MNKNKLSAGVKIGYGFGTLGECIAMNTFFIYFIFFLTNAAGIPASVAGTIAAISVFWGAFTDMFAGVKSDASRNPVGRRRPFIFKAAIPLGIVTFLMYTDFSGFSDGARFAYFLIASMVFWLSLSFTDIPYLSLGSEISDDYEERNTIRAIANVLNYLGMIVASSGTLVIVMKFSGKAGTSDPKGWMAVGIIFGMLTLIAYYISAISTKGKEAEFIPSTTEKGQQTGFFKSCKEVLALKPYRYILVYIVFGYGAVLLFTSIYIYYLTYNMGFSETQSATVMLVYSIMVIVISSILASIGVKIEKKTIVCASTFVLGVVMIVCKYTGLSGPLLYVVFFLFALAVSAYFVQIYSMIYDICDVDEYKYGGGRDGIIISLFYFFGKIISGISMFAVGWILTFANYDPEAWPAPQQTLDGIATGAMLLPGIGFVIAAIVMLKYPINKKNFAALREAIERKQAGEPYSEEGFKELL